MIENGYVKENEEQFISVDKDFDCHLTDKSMISNIINKDLAIAIYKLHFNPEFTCITLLRRF
jgi:hypothetical protein